MKKQKENSFDAQLIENQKQQEFEDAFRIGMQEQELKSNKNISNFLKELKEEIKDIDEYSDASYIVNNLAIKHNIAGKDGEE